MAESEMVERVSESIWQAEWTRAGNKGKRRAEWADQSEDTRGRYRPLARAALEAMRKPTLKMQNAGWAAIDKQDLDFEDVEVAPIFRAMISAALGQEGTEG